MSDVELLWFECANPECRYVPAKTKRDKIKYWKRGKSIEEDARRRLFLSYVKGEKIFREGLITFKCEYGSVCLYDELDYHKANSQVYPLKDKRICGVCTTRIISGLKLHE